MKLVIESERLSFQINFNLSFRKLISKRQQRINRNKNEAELRRTLEIVKRNIND